jgi:hypothetical protein
MARPTQSPALLRLKKPISCGAIAKQLKRNPVSISRACVRLGIKPDLVIGSFKFFGQEKVALIKRGMRAKNGNGNGSNGHR